jgi:hypothetical protein
MIVGTRVAPPRAGAMLESLRGLGYSAAGALADIVDNSISAGATEVKIDFTWCENLSRISVLDNGRGMTDSELEVAMQLGGKSPLDARDASDLGRFGMGLKTASFSQCRRLTVASVKNGVLSCLRWDLDALAANPSDGWLLFEGTAHGSEKLLSPLFGHDSGTLVLWEEMDRIISKGYVADDFLDLICRVEAHLSMVFHRFLQGIKPSLHLILNGRKISPWDPFMIGHPSKPWNSPVAKIPTDTGVVQVECHVLPHRDKLTPREFEVGGGAEGWTAQQGFYVYRNQRLLVAGGWLGLGLGRAWNREEAHRLARISLDIPNTADADWKIDIRKSTARPPVSLRPWLTRLAEDTRERARKVFAYRGSPILGVGGVVVDQAWRVEHSKSGARYRIDEKHPAISAALAASGASLPIIKSMIRVIEETVPVQRIWLDTAENKDIPLTGFAGEPPENVIEVLKTIFDDMVGRRCISPDLAKKMLLSTEPFQNYPTLIVGLPN